MIAYSAYRQGPTPSRVTFGHRPKIDGFRMAARFARLPAWAPVSEGQEHKPRRILIAEVQSAVARAYGLSLTDMLSSRRTWDISHPRQVAMYLCRKHTRANIAEIGRRFGGRDHTTVLHAFRAIGDRRTRDAEVEAVIQSVEAVLLA